jgi:hypothetical protein
MLSSGLVASPSDLHFDVLHTLEGKAFTNATITRVTAAYAIVDFDGGGIKIALTNLPEGIRNQVGFDSQRAQEEINADKQKKKDTEQKRMAAISDQEEAEKDRSLRWIDGKLVHLYAFDSMPGYTIAQVLSNGVLAEFHYSAAASKSGFLTENQRSGAYAGPGEVARPASIGNDKTIFIRCPTNGLVDGQAWDGYCFRTGTYSYKRSDGTTATLEKYDTGLSYSTKTDVIHRAIKD